MGVHCKNCYEPLDHCDRYCGHCGQKVQLPKLSLITAIGDYFENFFAVEGKAWRTLKAVIIMPGTLSRAYLDGKRVRYVNPFKFFFFLTIVFTLLIQIDLAFDDDKSKDEEIIKIEDSDKPRELTEFSKYDQSDSDKEFVLLSTVNRMKKFYNVHQSGSNLSMEQALDSLKFDNSRYNQYLYTKASELPKNPNDTKWVASKILPKLSLSLFLLAPFIALILKLLYVRRNIRYMEHLVWLYYNLSRAVLVLILFTVLQFYPITPDAVLVAILAAATIGLLFSMNSFYRQGWFKTVVKFLLLNFVMIFILVLFTFIIYVAGVFL